MFFLLLSCGSHGGFCPQASAPGSCDFLHSPFVLYRLGGSGLLCDLTSLLDLRIIVDFSIWSGFYKLLGQSGAF